MNLCQPVVGMEDVPFAIPIDDVVENNDSLMFLNTINECQPVVEVMGTGLPFWGGVDAADRAALTQYWPHAG